MTGWFGMNGLQALASGCLWYRHKAQPFDAKIRYLFAVLTGAAVTDCRSSIGELVLPAAKPESKLVLSSLASHNPGHSCREKA